MILIKASEAKRNIRYKIDHISGQEKCRLLEIGFIRGAMVEIIKISSNGGLIILKLNNCKIAIRLIEASDIFLSEDL